MKALSVSFEKILGKNDALAENRERELTIYLNTLKGIVVIQTIEVRIADEFKKLLNFCPDLIKAQGLLDETAILSKIKCQIQNHRFETIKIGKISIVSL